MPSGEAAGKLVRLLQLEAHLAAVLVAFGPIEVEGFDHVEGIDAFVHEGHEAVPESLAAFGQRLFNLWERRGFGLGAGS